MVLEQHEENTGEKIAIKIYDTDGSAVKTVLKARELLNDKVNMVIGPVMSNAATAAAALLSEYPNRCVMITPTATDDGIADLGKNIFQINLTQKALAEKIANYAIDDLSIRRFTILAPLNEYGRTMTDYFTATVKARGAEVEFTEYYSPNATDHRKQFNSIREHYANVKFGEALADSRQRSQYLADSTIALGGLFIPVSLPENAIQMAAQVPFHKLRGQILGANVWDNQKVINEGKSTVQNICFSSAQKIDKDNEAFRNFINNYKSRFGEEPSVVVAPLVADATALMLKAYSQSNSSADLSKNLLLVSGYQGLSSEISFSNSVGVNIGAVVMKISGQRAVRVK
jgi:ABC-type branched-subunit amino acid transport system substrate-binding protein